MFLIAKGYSISGLTVPLAKKITIIVVIGLLAVDTALSRSNPLNSQVGTI